ncbi:MAG: CPBP family glutamic-type intramembrane protease [Phycisphaerae bacterium]|nr:CPBP family glutamic-type intramembrane protease [Phycisphaerae bacterium]
MGRRKSDGTDTQAKTAIPVSTGYYARTARPIYGLVFILPFIILYEILVLAVNPQMLTAPASNVRGAVVSFVWVQNFLQYIGMDTKNAWLFAPAAVIVTLIVLQLTSRQSWKIKVSDFLIMAGECIVLAIPLIIFALVLNRAPNRQSAAVNFSPVTLCQTAYDNSTAEQNSSSQNSHIGLNRKSVQMDLLTGIGAGIYEELIFRLVLISLSMMFFEIVLGVPKTKAVIISVIISSVLFSLHHHFIFLNGQFAKTEIFTMTRFAFRTIAGVFFAIIFAVRGFGIAAGTHAFYDIIATLLNTWFFGYC